MEKRTDAQKVSDMLNSFSFSPDMFCEEMAKEHKTLQQSFTRLCVTWLLKCSEDNYLFDGRNEASHMIGKEFREKIGDTYLPFI